MKHFLFIFVFLLSPLFISAQVTSGQSNEKALSEENQQLVDSITDLVLERAMLSVVDSLRDSGRYMQAMNVIDVVIDKWWENGKKPTISMYMNKSQILLRMEEYESVIQTCDECLSLHKDETDQLADLMLPVIYKMKGEACRYSNQYKDAILSYEQALFYYTKDKQLDKQGDAFYSMAYCYEKMGKEIMASSFNEKGLAKYLEYFGISKSELLKSNFTVTDYYKQLCLDVFAGNLYNMAVREQNLGNRRASQEYLLMSAHCGNEQAISEYNRIYGKY